jgi:serine/threonine protein kinase
MSSGQQHFDMRLLHSVTSRLSGHPGPSSDAPVHSVRRRKSSDPTELRGTIAQGRYQIEGPIGTGACGIIYSAWQPQLQRRVAIKVLRTQYARDPQMVHRLQHEANMASTVRCEHVIEVLDFGDLDNGQAYVAMEFIDGSRLSDFLDQNGALDVPLAIDIGIQLTKALRATHQAGIFHGDVKPDNILLCRRADHPTFVKLIDFGVAGNIDVRATPQRHSTVCGTPSYMSPEQASGELLDGRTDIYSLGVVLYEMLSGTKPIRGSHPRELLNRQRMLPPVPLRSNPRSVHVPPRVEAIVHRCLEKDPARRYQDAAVLLRDLMLVQARLETQERAQSSQPPRLLDQRPSIAGLPKLPRLATAVPANDLGLPMTTLSVRPILSHQSPSQTPSPPSTFRTANLQVRLDTSKWETSTRASRRHTSKPGWLRKFAPILIFGVALGYASASAVTQLSSNTQQTR